MLYVLNQHRIVFCLIHEREREREREREKEREKLIEHCQRFLQRSSDCF